MCVRARARVHVCACVRRTGRKESSGAPHGVTPSRPKALGLHAPCTRLLVEMDTCATVSMLRCSTVRACVRSPVRVCTCVYARLCAWVRGCEHVVCVCPRVWHEGMLDTLERYGALRQLTRIVVPPHTSNSRPSTTRATATTTCLHAIAHAHTRTGGSTARRTCAHARMPSTFSRRELRRPQALPPQRGRRAAARTTATVRRELSSLTLSLTSQTYSLPSTKRGVKAQGQAQPHC